jgi:HEAT repeat protein
MWLPPEGERKRLYLVTGIGGGVILLLLGAWRFLSPKDEARPSAAGANSEIQDVQQKAKRGDVEGLKQAARSRNTVAASTAVYELSRRPDAPQYVPMYREMMTTPTYAAPVRVQAISAFGRNVPTRDGYQEVEKIARDDADVAVKLAAINAMEEMLPSWRSLATLVTLMDHSDERVRAAALHAFQSIARLRIDTDDPKSKQPGYKVNDPVDQRRAVLRRVQQQFLGNQVLAARYEDWAKQEWTKQREQQPKGK